MVHITNKSVVAIGEAMIEMAPLGDNLYRKGFAGDTYNTVWHMAQILGERAKCGFFSKIGRDGVSNSFANELSADGLCATYLSRDETRTMGLYLIELDGTERSFLYWRQNSAAKLLADDPEVLKQALKDAGLVHLSGITLAILSSQARKTLLVAIREARAAGSIISFDPNFRPRLWTSQDEAREVMNDFFSHTDVALPSFDDEKTLWSDATLAATVNRLTKFGIKDIAVKNGSGPVTYLRDGRIEVCETPPAQHIRDTTGAGDAFNAGYLAARLLGTDALASVRSGQKLAAAVIKCSGARLPLADARTVASIVLS